MAQANLEIGMDVTFSVETNKDGMPQAREVGRFDGSAPMLPALTDGRKGESKGRKKNREGKAKRKARAEAKSAPPLKEADGSAPDRGTEGDSVKTTEPPPVGAGDEKPEGNKGASEASEPLPTPSDPVVPGNADATKPEGGVNVVGNVSNAPTVENVTAGNEGDAAEEEAVDYEADES